MTVAGGLVIGFVPGYRRFLVVLMGLIEKLAATGIPYVLLK
jgi:hypothetical protein